MNDYDEKPATIRQVRDMIGDRPTRWEMRALLALAVVANQLIPTLGLGSNPVHTAASFMLGVF